jgi:putative spermidine/putrescine transport system substrate-binding protein
MSARRNNPQRSRTLTRREVLAGAAGAGLGVFAAGRIGDVAFGLAQAAPATSPVKLTLFSFPGLSLSTVAKEVAKTYMASHPGVTLDVLEGTAFEVYPKMLSARRLTPNQPIVHFGYMNTAFTFQGDKDEMWDALDPANIPNMKNIAEAYHRPGNHGVGHSSSPVGLMYSTRHVTQPPTSWADLWNPRFKGKVTAIGRYNWYLNGLVMAARLNGGNERNIDAGFKLWSERADQYVAFANSNPEQLDMLVRGDAHIAAQFAGNVLTWKREGAPIEFVIPREGMIAFPLFFIVVKGLTPQQKRTAEDVINVMLSERWLARWATVTLSVPATKKSIVPPSLRTLPMFDPNESARAIQLDWATIASNDAAWRERWDKEVVAKIPR